MGSSAFLLQQLKYAQIGLNEHLEKITHSINTFVETKDPFYLNIIFKTRFGPDMVLTLELQECGHVFLF